MIRPIKHKNRLLALVAVLALALVFPVATLAEGEPTVSLYMPATGASTSSHQKILFSLSEHVSFGDNKSISLTPEGGSTYTAKASDGSRIGNSSVGPYYVSYDLGDFGLSSLEANKNYSVVAEAGAFIGSSNSSAEATGTFTTGDGGGKLVLYTPTNNQKLQTGGSDIVSGQSVASGSPISLANADDGSYAIVKTVYINGSKTEGVDFASYTLSGDLEVYFRRTDGTLTGTVAISGHEYFGGELSGTLSDLNQPDSSGIHFQWVRVGDSVELLESGGTSTKHTVVAADLDKVIRLDVTDTTLTDGKLSDSTGTITKAPYSGTVQPPAQASSTSSSITLVAVSGYEYSSDNVTWQTDPSFTGLTTGTAYDFYQRVAATTTTLASDTSTAKLSIKATLSGTVSISGTAQSGVALTGSITGGPSDPGTITYAWTRGGTAVGDNNATYTPNAGDVGSKLTLTISTSNQNGTIFTTTANVLKAANTTTPVPPVKASTTATSITLTAVSGYEYSLGGTNWQTSTTFTGLAAGATYSFYQRVAATSTVNASATSTRVDITTLSGLTGTVMSSGEARYGITMTANLSPTNNTGTLTYTWKRGTMNVGNGTSYAVQAADISNTLSVEVTSSVQSGVITRSFGTVAKAYYVGNAPDAPTRSSRTTTKIVLKSVDDCEYSRGGTTWQDSTTFSGLKAGTELYVLPAGDAATATMEASENERSV